MLLVQLKASKRNNSSQREDSVMSDGEERRIEKEVVKEALAELLGEMPAFRAFLSGSSGAGASSSTSSKDGSEETSGSKFFL